MKTISSSGSSRRSGAGVILAIIVASGCASASTANSTDRPSMSVVAHSIVEDSTELVTPTGTIHGTLELPAAATPVPVVLIIAGSGPTDRDGNSPALPGANNSLKMLADGLAAEGVASVRYDKRGVAGSRAAANKEDDLRFSNFVDDASAWIRQLRADKRFSTITIAGHSEGSLIGMIAARAAAADGYVSLEGTGRNAKDIITAQLAAQLPANVVEQATAIMGKVERGEKADSVPPFLAALFRPSVQPYLASWFKITPTAEIARLTIPVLVVQGTTDIQTSEEDAKLLAGALPSARLLMVDGMNHVLKAAPADRALQGPAYSDPTIPVVPRLLTEVSAFVKAVPER
ncbi:MAG: alpha/beta fold hydrolase [Gemmatimonadaceae bacterium]